MTVRRILGSAAALAAGLVLAGCSSSGRPLHRAGSLPPDLPGEPVPCASYCKVWVPPVYRDVPVLERVTDGGMVSTPETVREMRYREVEVRPRTTKWGRTEGSECEEAVVQVSGGGWRWRPDGNCWKYCYEPPEYTRCVKTVGEAGISYCTEQPPEYRTVAESREVLRERCEYVPPEYRVKWVREVYTPGRWEWRMREGCDDCVCPGCPPGISGRGLTPAGEAGIKDCCPRTN